MLYFILNASFLGESQWERIPRPDCVWQQKASKSNGCSKLPPTVGPSHESLKQFPVKVRILTVFWNQCTIYNFAIKQMLVEKFLQQFHTK